MNRNEQQMYSDISSIAKSLEKIANALDNNVTQTTKDIPGFEGTLDALDNLIPTSSNPDPAGYGNEDDNIKNDSDYDVRVDAEYYGKFLSKFYNNDNLSTKKDCILEYVTKAFRNKGARYTDIIKFAYYLGAPNAPKYDNSCRGYYAMAFNTRFGGHLVQGGKDYLVKGINKDGKERYFALSSVDNFTDYYKTIE